MSTGGSIIRGFTARLYPSSQQQERLDRWVGSLRFVWNRLLAEQQVEYAATGKFLWRAELQARVVEMKRQPETNWLSDLPAHALLHLAASMDSAFRRMISARKTGRAVGFPRFKKKFVNEPSIYCVNQRTTLSECGRSIAIPKLGATKVRGWRNLDGRLIGARVWRDAGNRWMISAQVECRRPAFVEPVMAVIGVDLGIKALATVYDGQSLVTVHNRRPLKKMLRRLRRMERCKSRRHKGSARRRAQARRIGCLHRKIRFQRADAIHQITHLLTAKAGVLKVEDLNVCAMQRGRHSRQIADVGFGQFLHAIAYKADWRGRELVKVDRWFPSSQVCSGCGQLHREMKRGLPTLRCDCGITLARDANAAINLFWYGEERRNRGSRPSTRAETGDHGLAQMPVVEVRIDAAAPKSRRRSDNSEGRRCGWR